MAGFIKKLSYSSLNTASDIFSVYLVFDTAKDFYNKVASGTQEPPTRSANQRVCKCNAMVDQSVWRVCVFLSNMGKKSEVTLATFGSEEN